MQPNPAFPVLVKGKKGIQKTHNIEPEKKIGVLGFSALGT
jgi:hypothetical protein